MPEVSTEVSAAARKLHQQALIIDGLTPYYTLDEPYTASLIEGGHYLRSTHWKGDIPKSDSISDYLDRLSN